MDIRDTLAVTLLTIRNAVGGLYSTITTLATTPRTYTFPDKNIYVAGLDDLSAISLDTKNPTGFVNPSGIDVSWNKTTRTVTLTGNLDYYFRGVKNPVTLTSPWTSSAHQTGDGGFFLISSDGVNFNWGTTPFNFIDVFAAYIWVRETAPASQFGIRECHGTMDVDTHKSAHNNTGTWVSSGGTLTAGTYVIGTGTLAAVTFGVDTLTVEDEDLPTVIPALPEGTYTTMHIGAGGVCTFNTTSPIPYIADTAAFIKVNNPANGLLTPTTNNSRVNVYLIAIPVTSDADSQKFRIICVQPQTSFTTLAAAQAENPSSLNLGNLAILATEWVFFARITLRAVTAYTNDGKCHIEAGGYLKLTRSAVVSAPTQTAGTVPATPTGSLTGLTVQELIDELEARYLVGVLSIANGGTGSSTGILHKSICDFRLTLTSGSPVTTTNVTGATTVYCTPYVGTSIALYDGTNWNLRQSAQFSIALGTLTSGLGYDVFCYDNAGTPTLELAAWLSATVRATALVYQDGVLCKSGATTRRYLGSFYTTSTTATEDSETKRYLDSYYHPVDKILKRFETTASWTQAVAAGYRQARASESNKVSMFKGTNEEPVRVNLRVLYSGGDGTQIGDIGLGLDSTTSPAVSSTGGMLYGSPAGLNAHFQGHVGIGKHDIVWLEACYISTINWYSVAGSHTVGCSGLLGSTKC